MGHAAEDVVKHAAEKDTAAVTTKRGRSSDGMDVDGEEVVKRGRSRSVRRSARHGDEPEEEDDDMGRGSSRSRSRSASRGRSASVDPKRMGLRDEAQQKKVQKLVKKMQRKDFFGTQGETDRHFPAKMPKHLFSGKRSIGSADWR